MKKLNMKDLEETKQKSDKRQRYEKCFPYYKDDFKN